MKIPKHLYAVIAALLLPAILSAAPTGSTPADDREVIRSAYNDWVKTIAARDVEAWASYLAPDAVFFPPNHAKLTTRDAILDYYAELFRDPRFALQCRVVGVEIAASGDMAWANGVCEATFTDASGNEAHGSSKWVKVWKKQPSGEWKCSVNIWNSSTPASP